MRRSGCTGDRPIPMAPGEPASAGCEVRGAGLCAAAIDAARPSPAPSLLMRATPAPGAGPAPDRPARSPAAGGSVSALTGPPAAGDSTTAAG